MRAMSERAERGKVKVFCFFLLAYLSVSHRLRDLLERITQLESGRRQNHGHSHGIAPQRP